MNKKICYVTGTRADFGLMQSTLQAIHDEPELQLSIVVTGTHLSERYGKTVTEIRASNFPIAACIEIDCDQSFGEITARNIGRMLIGMVESFSEIAPDIVLLLGDRGEMMAGALAAIHMNIPIVHIHGGERSGTVDEPIRHAISKLSHFHLVATPLAKERLIRMGEDPKRIEITGAPGLDGILDAVVFDRKSLLNKAGMRADRAVAILLYHPVPEDEDASAGIFVESVLDALGRHDIQVLAVRPNSDAGSLAIRKALDARMNDRNIRVVTHVHRDEFVSWMAAADLMIGNSSAGIIEAATFGTPVINIGSRQHLRERNANIVDVPGNIEAVERAIERVLARGRYEGRNVYGDGNAAARVVSFLKTAVFDRSVLAKVNGY